jgi:DNA-3-methyladenine glycosylase II
MEKAGGDRSGQVVPTKQQDSAAALRCAERHFRKADPIMARLIKEHGPCRLWTTKEATLFHNLASAIIAQQLSVKAADTIQGRVMQATSNPLKPGIYLAAEAELLRSAGLSKAKISYIRNLAEAIGNGFSKRSLQGLEDADAVARLTAVKGIGVWTAEMYLIFGLKRMDVLSLGDAGLQRAARNLYNRGQPREGLLLQIGETWRPYRSVACWYLWKSLGNE